MTILPEMNAKLHRPRVQKNNQARCDRVSAKPQLLEHLAAVGTWVRELI
jgi:hypothetical protein